MILKLFEKMKKTIIAEKTIIEKNLQIKYESGLFSVSAKHKISSAQSGEVIQKSKEMSTLFL